MESILINSLTIIISVLLINFILGLFKNNKSDEYWHGYTDGANKMLHDEYYLTPEDKELLIATYNYLLERCQTDDYSICYSAELLGKLIDKFERR